MVLHLPHAEGGSGVTFNDVTKDAVFYTTTSHFVVWVGVFSLERQDLWLSKNDLRDPHGHLPRFCSSVTSMSSFCLTISVRRDVFRLSHRTVSLSSTLSKRFHMTLSLIIK
jgi:hypothetical protein